MVRWRSPVFVQPVGSKLSQRAAEHASHRLACVADAAYVADLACVAYAACVADAAFVADLACVADVACVEYAACVADASCGHGPGTGRPSPVTQENLMTGRSESPVFPGVGFDPAANLPELAALNSTERAEQTGCGHRPLADRPGRPCCS